jgi:RHS repeat-associated protein
MDQTRERFVTDGVGNRLTKVVNDQTETYTYVTGTNKIQDISGPVAYTYDANGNITGIGSKVLTYNQNNRLVRVEENSNILGEYTYNGEGQRVIKTAGGVTTVFHYDFRGNIIGESDQDGNFTYEYLYKGGSRLGLVDVASGEIYSFLNDRLGTPQMLADSTNTIVWEGVYRPFGEAEVNPNSSVVNNFRFPGQYYDEETGFHYNYNRYYDPNTGRYLTHDPLSLVQIQIGRRSSLNHLLRSSTRNQVLMQRFLSDIQLYQNSLSSPQILHPFVYVLNNPINEVDAYGLILEADPFNLDFTPPLSFGVGGVIGIVDVNWNSEAPTRTNISLTTPQLGAGFNICLNINNSQDQQIGCEDSETSLEELPIVYSAGSRYLGVSFTDDFGKICINVGLVIGPLPVNVAVPASVSW